MSFTSLLSTVVLVSFLVTIIMAIGSYAAYKLREHRRPELEPATLENESLYFERITADELSATGPNSG
jgi:Tfp pilus assembly protein PilE